MKKLIITLSSLLNVVCMCAQTNSSKAEIEIRNLEESERNAMLKHDTVSLKKMWAEDFTVNAPFNRVLLSRQELMDMVNKGAIQFTSFSRNIEQVVVKKDIAVLWAAKK
jgi:hypothetical protein